MGFTLYICVVLIYVTVSSNANVFRNGIRADNRGVFDWSMLCMSTSKIGKLMSSF